jgi:hypothetical protein
MFLFESAYEDFLNTKGARAKKAAKAAHKAALAAGWTEGQLWEVAAHGFYMMEGGMLEEVGMWMGY